MDGQQVLAVGGAGSVSGFFIRELVRWIRSHSEPLLLAAPLSHSTIDEEVEPTCSLPNTWATTFAFLQQELSGFWLLILLVLAVLFRGFWDCTGVTISVHFGRQPTEPSSSNYRGTSKAVRLAGYLR